MENGKFAFLDEGLNNCIEVKLNKKRKTKKSDQQFAGAFKMFNLSPFSSPTNILSRCQYRRRAAQSRGWMK